MFADDVALYKEIITESDSKLLQTDLDSNQHLKWNDYAGYMHTHLTAILSHKVLCKDLCKQ